MAEPSDAWIWAWRAPGASVALLGAVPTVLAASMWLNGALAALLALGAVLTLVAWHSSHRRADRTRRERVRMAVEPARGDGPLVGLRGQRRRVGVAHHPFRGLRAQAAGELR